ncbi:MAG: VOC family protein [Planctomycetota bacterium]
MITGLAHACYTASDLDASIDFYCNKLGLKKAFDFINDRGERFGVYIHVGGRSFIELFVGEVTASGEGTPYRHICLEVDDINTTVDHLRKQGLDVTDPKMGSDGSWQAWLADPDDNRIELHHYTERSRQRPHLQ